MTSVAAGPARQRAAGRMLRGFPELAAAVADLDAPAWLAEVRRAGVARFAEVGLPGSKDEEWRFTPLQAIASQQFGARRRSASVSARELEPYLLGGLDWPLLVLVDGEVDPDLSRVAGLPDGVTFGSLADAIRVGHPVVERYLAHFAPPGASAFAAISAALVRDGTLVHLGRGAAVRQPLHVVSVCTVGSARSIVAPRTLVVLEAGAEATVVESFVTVGAAAEAAGGLTNACAEIVLGEGARLEHIRLQREAVGGFHVGFTAVNQARDSHYRSFALGVGSTLSRHDLHARLDGINVETLLYGLYLARGDQLVDNHTAIYHDRPGCRSWEVYKGVLAEQAHGVFNGKVIVQPEAQQTDAKQTNRNLLLGGQAKVDTKPQLEIFADDVKCTHGATVGKLDEQQRFYLRSRGIAGRAAEVLLITAFIAEVLAEIVQPEAREAIRALAYAEMDALIA